MLIVAFAFIVGASAQCDVQDCLNRYQQAVSIEYMVLHKYIASFSKIQIADAGSDTSAILQATSNFCNEDCVSACSNDSSFSSVTQGITIML